MSYKVLKVFEVLDMPNDIKQTTAEWLRDLNRTAIIHTIEYWTAEEYKEWYPDKVQYACSPLDVWLIEQGAQNDEEVVLLYDW